MWVVWFAHLSYSGSNGVPPGEASNPSPKTRTKPPFHSRCYLMPGRIPLSLIGVVIIWSRTQTYTICMLASYWSGYETSRNTGMQTCACGNFDYLSALLIARIHTHTPLSSSWNSHHFADPFKDRTGMRVYMYAYGCMDADMGLCLWWYGKVIMAHTLQDPNVRDTRGWTPANHAAFHGRLGAMQVYGTYTYALTQ